MSRPTYTNDAANSAFDALLDPFSDAAAGAFAVASRSSQGVMGTLTLDEGSGGRVLSFRRADAPDGAGVGGAGGVCRGADADGGGRPRVGGDQRADDVVCVAVAGTPVATTAGGRGGLGRVLAETPKEVE